MGDDANEFNEDVVIGKKFSDRFIGYLNSQGKTSILGIFGNDSKLVTNADATQKKFKNYLVVSESDVTKCQLTIIAAQKSLVGKKIGQDLFQLIDLIELNDMLVRQPGYESDEKVFECLLEIVKMPGKTSANYREHFIKSTLLVNEFSKAYQGISSETPEIQTFRDKVEESILNYLIPCEEKPKKQKKNKSRFFKRKKSKGKSPKNESFEELRNELHSDLITIESFFLSNTNKINGSDVITDNWSELWASFFISALKSFIEDLKQKIGELTIYHETLLKYQLLLFMFSEEDKEANIIDQLQYDEVIFQRSIEFHEDLIIEKIINDQVFLNNLNSTLPVDITFSSVCKNNGLSAIPVTLDKVKISIRKKIIQSINDIIEQYLINKEHNFFYYMQYNDMYNASLKKNKQDVDSLWSSSLDLAEDQPPFLNNTAWAEYLDELQFCVNDAEKYNFSKEFPVRAISNLYAWIMVVCDQRIPCFTYLEQPLNFLMLFSKEDNLFTRQESKPKLDINFLVSKTTLYEKYSILPILPKRLKHIAEDDQILPLDHVLQISTLTH